MAEIVEPHPKLIEYYTIAKSLWNDIDELFFSQFKHKDDNERGSDIGLFRGNKVNFKTTDEWHYIVSNIEQNIFLLKRLDELGLLREENHMVDCGIGLGTSLYDFYLQSKDFSDKTFTFTGIEKYQLYTDMLSENLLDKWNEELDLIIGDINDYNYSKFNIVYTFTPFKSVSKLKEFYSKIKDEVSIGSILIENKNSGLGEGHVLLEVEGLKRVEVDDISVFVKI